MSGYGTDGLKAEKKNGISDLLGSASSVTIDTNTMKGEIVFTCDDYQYSNTGKTIND